MHSREPRLHNRILSAILALVLLFGCMPIRSAAGEQATFYITSEGQEITGVSVPRNQRRTITAQGLSENAEYQWQIALPNDEGWVDIFGQESASLTVSYALTANIMDENGVTSVRCTAVDGDAEYVSAAVQVEITAPEEIIPQIPTEETEETTAPTEIQIEGITYEADAVETDVLFADGDETTEATETTDAVEFITITVSFYQDVLGTNQNTQYCEPYVATIKKGTAFTAQVKYPVVTGYAPYIDGVKQTATYYERTFSESETEESIEIQVVYERIPVTYKVRYYLQEVATDNYTQMADEVISEGLPEEQPDSEDVYRYIEGFTALFYQPDKIAADGSTEFEVYYDRNYYLVNFEQDGGYGTAPIYARYGTTFTPATPTRKGYVFAGWDCVETVTMDPYQIEMVDGTPSMKDNDPVYILDADSQKQINRDADGTIILTEVVRFFAEDDNAELGVGTSSVIPAYNQTYNAIWTQADTTFTVIYWVQNANDDGYSYAHSVENVPATSGDLVSIATLEDRFGVSPELPDENALKDYSMPDTTKTTSAIVEGDGSTIFNVYYKRNSYLLKFYYARSYESSDTLIYQIPTNVSGYNNGSSAGDIHSATWTEVEKEPVLTGATKESESVTYNDVEYTYYYLTISAKYQADISAAWPASNISATEYSLGGWCSQYGSGFSVDNASKIINGPYFNLDQQLIVDANDTVEKGKTGHTLLAYWIDDPVLMEFWAYANIIGGKEEYEKRTPQATQVEMYPDCFDAGSAPYNDLYFTRWSTKALQYFERVEVIPVSKQSGWVYNNPRFSLKGMVYHARDDKSDLTYTNSYGNTVKVYIYHYARKTYSLQFSNYESSLLEYKASSLNDYTGNGVFYGADLSTYLESATDVLTYPSALEPNAFYFDGWYTGPKGTGMKIVIDNSKEVNEKDLTQNIWYNPTMPDDNLILFSNWVPKTYTVEFFWDYDEMKKEDGAKVREDATVEHGERLDSNNAVDIPSYEVSTGEYGNPNYDEATDKGMYSFGGWFYEEGDEQIAFDPNDMVYTSDLKLYAKWNTKVATTYQIRYLVAATNSDGSLATDENGDYYAQKDENGDVIELANPTTGYLFIGTTKTFTAKAGNTLTMATGDGIWLPQTGTHSILINKDATKNTFDFLYIQKSSIKYTVEYRYAEDNTLITSINQNGDAVSGQDTYESTAAVVSVLPPYFAGYTSSPRYETKVLSMDESQNVITFYYSKNEVAEDGTTPVNKNHYIVHYMLQDLDDPFSFTEQNTVSGTEVFDTEIKLSDYTGDAGKTYTGFTYKPEFTVTVGDTSQTFRSGIVSKETDGSISIKDSAVIGKEIVEMYLYYERNRYPFEVRYIEYGTTNAVADPELYSAEKDTAMLYESTFTAEAKEIGGYDLVSASPQSKTVDIEADANAPTQNIITFYYQKKDVVVNYIPVLTDAVRDTTGWLSMTVERPVDYVTDINGSTPNPPAGYEFVGWFYDEACTSAVGQPDTIDDDTKMLRPVIDSERVGTDNYTFNFYAKFVPIKGSLKIIKDISNVESCDDTFLLKVTSSDAITGAVDLLVAVKEGTPVMITNLYYGTYTVTELTDWSWKYKQTAVAPEGGIVQIDTQGETESVTFTNSAVTGGWFGGESSNENHFAAYSAG